MTVKTAELLCVHCGKGWGDHADLGSWCLLDGPVGPIFSKTDKFSAAPVEWKPGDAYAVLNYEGLNIVGIVASVSLGYVQVWEVITYSDGALSCFQKATYRPADITRMVPA